MEMLRKKKDNSEYEIDRELTGKFAIEKNAEYQDRIAELEEENRNLKSDLEQFSEAYKRYRDFEKEELADSCYDLEKENKKLKEELKDKQKVIQYYRKEKKLMGTHIKKLKEELRKYKKQYQHSMGFSDFGGYDEDEHIVKDENTYRDLDL